MDQTRVQDLCTRGHHSPFHSSLAALTPQSIPPGYWISSLLSYGFQGNAGPTKPLRSKPCPAPPELYDSLTGTISTTMRCNKAQHAYLRDRHLSTYADLVACGQAPHGGGTFWSFHPTSLTLYVASPYQLALQSNYFRGKPGTSQTLLEPTHRNPYCLHVQYPTGLLIRHRLQTLAAPSSSPIPYAADSRHQAFHLSSIMVPLT